MAKKPWRFMKKRVSSLPPVKYYSLGKKFLMSSFYQESIQLTRVERKKKPSRTEIINYLLSTCSGPKEYLEIGIRNPEDNFAKINADVKYSVDPGLDFPANPADFKMTSDKFFQLQKSGTLLPREQRFDLIFIDGLHLAEQADRDIRNSLDLIKDDGFIVVHDCNPPTEWHARETYHCKYTPAGIVWNGTTWKAFLKWRANPSVYSCCVDSDWGVGILSKTRRVGNCSGRINEFYEFSVFNEHKREFLGLVDMETLKSRLG